MYMKPFYLILLSFIMIGTSLQLNAQLKKAESEKVTADNDNIKVYYFHNTRRCATCQAVEDVTKTTIDENYAEQLKSGTIIFESLNIEEDENTSVAEELQVSGQSLIFVKNGKVVDLTNDAFLYARTNPEKLQKKIIKTIDSM